MAKVHLNISGHPACNCQKRWSCTQISSVKNPVRVTCGNCKRITA